MKVCANNNSKEVYFLEMMLVYMNSYRFYLYHSLRNRCSFTFSVS